MTFKIKAEYLTAKHIDSASPKGSFLELIKPELLEQDIYSISIYNLSVLLDTIQTMERMIGIIQ